MMGYYSRICVTILLLGTGILFLFGCDNKQTSPKLVEGSKGQRVNLFPKEEEVKPLLTKTFEEAWKASDLVLKTNQLTRIDSSYDERGNTTFYLYNVTEGKLEKGVLATDKKDQENKGLGVYFVSKQPLEIQSTEKDSIYVFLNTVSDKSIIKSRLAISYEWVDYAPIQSLK